MCRSQDAEDGGHVRNAFLLRPKAIRPKPLPRLFALPDGDDSEALVRGAGGVQHEPFRNRALEGICEALVVLPARRHVVDERVGHAADRGVPGCSSDIGASASGRVPRECERVAEILVLGPVALGGRASPTTPPAMLQRLMAALVLAEGRVRHIEELVDVLWGEDPPTSARQLVRVYVSQLRKALPTGVAVETVSGGYVLRLPDGTLDAARFERLVAECRQARRDGNAALAVSLAEQALALWRGRAFGELAYEELARVESERLEEQRLVAREERLHAHVMLGRHAELLGEILAFADEHPLREHAHELAMLALYRCGRQTDALEHYAAVRERLNEELGLEPGPAIRELHRRILGHDPELAAAHEDGPEVTSLPEPPNPLVGRERELAELDALLARRDSRLIVLTGAGGSGKTRLALEAARRAARSFANGVVLVELASVRDPELVLPTIAHAVGAADAPGKPPLDAVGDALLSRELLLLIDNVEHLRTAAPSLVKVLARAPRLVLLVTSRAVLHVSGERVFPVAPLEEEAAVKLFEQRAQSLQPAFRIDAQNEDLVREICRRLDGLPLAIELAAARIRTLAPRSLVERLSQRLALLTWGARDLPARQQTLRETIDWSVGLLSESERRAFARLAALPAGATLDAAQIVCGADLDNLATLVDDNLLTRTDVAGEPRFGMLETVREYALELLGSARGDVELALADYFATAADGLRRSAGAEHERRRIVERLVPEIDNVRVALAAAAEKGDGALQLRLAGGLWRYWGARGPVGEGLAWIEQALAVDDGEATAARAHALQGAARLAWLRGDVTRAEELASAAIPVAVAAASTWDEGAAHTVLGVVANTAGDRERARFHHRRSIELAEKLGVEPVVEKLNLGSVALDASEYQEAIALFEDVLASHRRNDNSRGAGIALLNLGLAHHELGDDRASRSCFEEALERLAEAGLRELAFALQGLAAADANEGRFERAARLLGQARRELDDFGTPEDAFAPEMVAETKAKARAALGDEAYEAAFSAGTTEREVRP